MTDDIHDHLDALSDWQERAQQAAEQHDHDETVKAVQEVEMTEAEREAAGHLYAALHDTIEQVCEIAYRKADRDQYRPTLELEDLLHESYILFLRALVGYDPDQGDLDTYLLHALRRRVRVYLESKSTDVDTRDEEDRTPQPSVTEMRQIDVVAVVQEMLDNGRLDGDQDRLESLWQDIRTAPA